MIANELMTTDLVVCHPEDSLNEAVRRMWERDLGYVVITNEGGELRGVLTDRDACIAAYTQGRLLSDIRIAEVMSPAPVTCDPSAAEASVHDLMREHAIRRLPVVENGLAVGVISLNDLALAAQRSGRRALEETAKTLATVCEHRQPSPDPA